MHPLIRKIETALGLPGLVDRLDAHLSGSEFSSLLLALFHRRAARLRPPQVLQHYVSNRFCAPSPIDQRHYLRYELEWLEHAAAHGFRTVQFSPLAPLGACSALGPVHQNNVVSAVRGTEIVSDATNVLALHIAADVKEGRPAREYCTAHRHVRSQALAHPAHTAHFSVFCAASGGADSGNHRFEVDHLLRHIALYHSFLARHYAPGDLSLKIYLKEDNPPFHQLLHEQLADNHLGMKVQWVPPPGGSAYYEAVQFKIFMNHKGTPLDIADGGLVDWTQKLLQNRKHRLFISGVGLDILLKIRLGLV